MTADKHGRPLELCDYSAAEVVGVQVSYSNGRYMLHVCIDGTCVLRVDAPLVDISDIQAKVCHTDTNSDKQTEHGET